MNAKPQSQGERLLWLIRALLAEDLRYRDLAIPDDPEGKWHLYRVLANVRPPRPVSDEYLRIQDAYLQDLLCERGVADYRELEPRAPHLYLWQGDITTLAVDAIVNAANSQMLGCFYPNHGCIDNAIHTFAGVELRLACAELMAKQGHEEPPGHAKVTPAFNLPSRFVIHTVGPVVRGAPTPTDRALLASCYLSCLDAAAERDLASIAFCCVSTGEFGYPQDEAAEVAIATVGEWRQAHGDAAKPIDVVFNVFKDDDYAIYERFL